MDKRAASLRKCSTQAALIRQRSVKPAESICGIGRVACLDYVRLQHLSVERPEVIVARNDAIEEPCFRDSTEGAGVLAGACRYRVLVMESDRLHRVAGAVTAALFCSVG